MGLTFGREAVFRAKWSNKASELQNQLFEGKIVGGGGGMKGESRQANVLGRGRIPQFALY